jgi:hypothetical protein
VTQGRGAALLGGVFSDPSRARDAFDTLIGEATRTPNDVDVVFYCSNGEYLLVVAAKTQRAEDWATRVLRDRGALVQAEVLTRRLSELRNELIHGGSRADRWSAEERSLFARWATVAALFIERGLVEPADLLALLVTSPGSPAAPPAGDRPSRLQDADAELQEVSARLEASLRARHPELFDRAGRLRTAELTRRLAERTGGKRVLSGDDLLDLETETDEEATRSASAP